jgi:hypothetical protein
MSDITISVIQPPSTTINVGVDETTLIQAGMGLPPHSVTHISGGSDEINHNLLGGLQGGSGNEFYHLNSGQYFNLITGSGSFYPNSNPSGFITGVDLSNYSTIDYTTGISGGLQNQITILNNTTGSYILNSETGQFYSNSNPSGFITGINNIVFTTGNQVISGAKTFTGSFNVSTHDPIIIRSTGYTHGVEIGGGYYNKIADGGFINDFGVDGIENHFGDRATSSNSFGGNASQNDFGAYATLNNYYGGSVIGQFDFDTLPTVNSTGVLLSGEATTESYVTGISGNLQSQITTLNNQTGSFYPRTNPSGYITGINNLVFTTGNQTISGIKTFSNNLVVGGNDLFVNTSTDRVGIFTDTPTATLDINGSGVFRSGLNVIGTGTIYDTALNINGALSVNNSYFNGEIWQSNPGGYVAIADSNALNYIEVSDFGVTLEASTKSFQVYAPTRMHYALTGTIGRFTSIVEAPNLIYNTGNQTINGVKNFTSILTVNNTGIYLNSNPSGYITGISNIVFTTGNQSISGIKTFNNNLIVNGNDLFVNTSSNRIGIRTASPTAELDVNGSGLFRSGLRVNSIKGTGQDFLISNVDNASNIFGANFLGGLINISGGNANYAGGGIILQGGSGTDQGGNILLKGGIKNDPNIPNGVIRFESENITFNQQNNYSSNINFWKTGLSTIAQNVRISQDSVLINNNLLISGNRPTVNSTGILLSGEATTETYVTGISGGLQTQITTLNNQTGSYYPRTNPSGYITGVDLSFSGNYYTKNESESRYVNTTGTETILGDKTFHDKVYINNLYVTGLETIINTTNTNVASNYLLLNLTGGAVDGGIFFITGSGLTGINDSGAIIGFDHSDKFKFGIGTRASDLSTLNTIAAYEEVTGISGGLQIQISTLNSATGNYALKIETGNFITNSQTGQFYANSNPSGFITGVDLSSYATQDYVTGISGELQTQITNLNNATGSYILNSQTGDFYASSNPSGFITGIENIVFTTGDQTISGIKTFDSRPFVNGTGVMLSGEAAQLPTTLVYTTGNQDISDVKNFLSVPTISGNPIATISDPVRTTLIGNGVISGFAISGASGLTNPSALIVAIDGAMQEPIVDYVLNTGSIFFTSPLPSGSKAVVISPSNFYQVGQITPSDGSVTSSKLDNSIQINNLTVANNLTTTNNFTLNGSFTGNSTQNSLPNQTLTNSGSILTRDLMAMFLEKDIYNFSPAGFSLSTAISGAQASANANYLNLRGNTTAQASPNNLAMATVGSHNADVGFMSITNSSSNFTLSSSRGGSAGAYSLLDFSKRVILQFELSTNFRHVASNHNFFARLGPGSSAVNTNTGDALPGTGISIGDSYVAMLMETGSIRLVTNKNLSSPTESPNQLVSPILSYLTPFTTANAKFSLSVYNGTADLYIGNQYIGSQTGCPTHVGPFSNGIAFGCNSLAPTTTVGAGYVVSNIKIITLPN